MRLPYERTTDASSRSWSSGSSTISSSKIDSSVREANSMIAGSRTDRSIYVLEPVATAIGEKRFNQKANDIKYVSNTSFSNTRRVPGFIEIFVSINKRKAHILDSVSHAFLLVHVKPHFVLRLV